MKNNDQNKMKAKYYFFLDHEGIVAIINTKEFESYMRKRSAPGYISMAIEKVVTVCLLEDHKGNVARGLAVLSKGDKFDYGTGKKYALQHATRAILGRKMKVYTDRRATDILSFTRCPFVWNGQLNPVLSEFERYLLYGSEREKKTVIPYIVDVQIHWKENPIKQLNKLGDVISGKYGSSKFLEKSDFKVSTMHRPLLKDLKEKK